MLLDLTQNFSHQRSIRIRDYKGRLQMGAFLRHPSGASIVAFFIIVVLVQMMGLSAFADPPAERPNVVLILADDLGIVDVGAYAERFTGTPVDQMFYETPNLNRLAKQSVVFSQAYACHLCSPTRASLLTGKYAERTGFTTAVGGTVRTFYNQAIDPPPGYVAQDAIRWQDEIEIEQSLLNGTTRDALATGHRLDNGHDETTLAEAMTEHDSAFIGKWHLGGHGSEGWQPVDNGFEEVSYFDEGGSPYFNWRKAWDSGRLLHASTPQQKLRRGKTGGDLGHDYLTDELTQHAVDYLHRKGAAKRSGDRTKPFFLHFCHFAVHTPFQAPSDDVDHFVQKLTRGWNGHRNAVYAAMVKRLDASVGRILKTIDDAGLGEDTLVVFFSDNGGVMYTQPVATDNGPFKGGKGLHFEGGVRVPLMVRFKGKHRPGVWSDVPVHCTDLFPTVLQLAGYDSKKFTHATGGDAIDGRSVAPLLQDPANVKRDYQRDTFFWHYPFNVIVKNPEDGLPSAPSSAIREGDWKLIFDWSGVMRLYNIPQDPYELQDRSEEKPEKALALFRRLNDWIDANVAAKYTPAHNPSYDAAKESRDRPFIDLRKKYLGPARSIRTIDNDRRFSIPR